MDPGTASRGLGDRGVSSVQFVFASALALLLFVALANLVVVQYGRGAIRSALEQGVRAGTTSGETACEETARGVVDNLLGGRMSDGLVLDCTVVGGGVTANVEVTFESWTPLTPDFPMSMSSRAVVEP